MKRRLSFRPRGESLEDRRLLSVTSFEQGGIGYFVSPTPGRLERYDIDQETWLSPIVLEGATATPTLITGDADGLYAAYDGQVVQYQWDGSHHVVALDGSNTVRSIQTDGNLMFVVTDRFGSFRYIVSIDKTTNSLITTYSSWVSGLMPTSISRENNLLISRADSQVIYYHYSDDGSLQGSGYSQAPSYYEFYGYDSYPEKWVSISPDDRKAIDNMGNIFGTDSFEAVDTVPGIDESSGDLIVDLVFHGDVPIALISRIDTSNDIQGSGNQRSPTLRAYHHSMEPAGGCILENSSNAPTKILVNDRDVVVFRPDPSSPTGFQTQAVPLASLRTPSQGELLDPADLWYTPDAVEVANDGTLLLLSRSQASIFRWDPDAQAYGESISLRYAPRLMTYSSADNCIYLAYGADTDLSVIDLDHPQPTEKHFATIAGTITGLTTAGKYVIVTDDANKILSLGPDGELIDSALASSSGAVKFGWNPVDQMLYFVDESGNKLTGAQLNENGVRFPGEAPGGIAAVNHSADYSHDDSFSAPILVAPDGSYALLGAGFTHESETLADRDEKLANSFIDGAWIGNDLYTTRFIVEITDKQVRYQHWSSAGLALDKTVSGGYYTPLALKSVGDNHLVSISMETRPRYLPSPPWFSNALKLIENLTGSERRPVITVLDAELNVVTPPNAFPTGIAVKDALTLIPELKVPIGNGSFQLLDSYETLMGTIKVLDDGHGVNQLTLSGPDADKFKISGTSLYLKQGVTIDYETTPSLTVTINVDDPASPASPDATTTFHVTVVNVNEAPYGLAVQNIVDHLDSDSNVSAPIRVADIVYTDDSLGVNNVTISGSDVDNFQLVGQELRFKPNQPINDSAKSVYHINVVLDDPAIGLASEQLLVFSVFIVNVWHNQEVSQDVNANSVVDPLDALLIINDLNRNGPHGLADYHPAQRWRIDTNNDYQLSAVDALLVVNALNAPASLPQPDLNALAMALALDKEHDDPATMAAEMLDPYHLARRKR